jgi:hypothetical protein
VPIVAEQYIMVSKVGNNVGFVSIARIQCIIEPREQSSVAALEFKSWNTVLVCTLYSMS